MSRNVQFASILYEEAPFVNERRILEGATLGGRTFVNRFLALRRSCTPSKKRGGSRLGTSKLRGKWPHKTHPRGGIGGRWLRRKRKNDRKSIDFGVPVSAIEMISPWSGISSGILRPSWGVILLIPPKRAARNFDHVSVIPPLALYPRSPYPGTMAARVEPYQPRVISFLCRHRYQK